MKTLLLLSLVFVGQMAIAESTNGGNGPGAHPTKKAASTPIIPVVFRFPFVA